jgi:(heptosyl)LPS beta-1,4-glucosyltransferase
MANGKWRMANGELNLTKDDPTLMLKAVILTLNEERHIAACIDSLRWTEGIVVVDSFSSDNTVELARQAGAEVIQHRFENYSQQRNVALENVAAEWIFFVDADERATPALGTEIREVIARQDKAGWWVPRHNYIFGHRMRGAGWWPDHQLRVLRRDQRALRPPPRRPRGSRS